MTPEICLIVLLIGIALSPLIFSWSRTVYRWRIVTGGIIAVAVGVPLTLSVAAWTYRHAAESIGPMASRPVARRGDGYQSSASCRSCHPHEHATWHASFHRTMTQVASPNAMLPPLDGDFLQLDGVSFRLRTAGEQVWADMRLPEQLAPYAGPRQMTRQIVMTTGSHHMQLFWYPISEESRLVGMFPFVFLREEQRWIPRGAAFLQPSYSFGDELGRWNQTCIACHATYGRMLPEYEIDPESGEKLANPSSLATAVAEFGIACEACHGPGTEHVRANQNPLHRYRQHLSLSKSGAIVNPAGLDHRRSSQVCGQCHAVQCVNQLERWWDEGFSYRPGDDLAASPERFIFRVADQEREDHREFLAVRPAFIEDHFWSDGMVRISGREYSGLIETPCYQRGQLSCLSCHQMHQSIEDSRSMSAWADDQLNAELGGNHACLQCHDHLRDTVAVEAHTHHAPESSGSVCYNCHMPHTTYGLLKAIRSHQIDSPSVQATLATGRPNACNQCHLDRTLAWTADYLYHWYDVEAPALSEDEQTIAASVLWALRGDAGQRALAAWSFGWREAREASTTDWIPPLLTQLLNDPYAAVRYIAERSLRNSEAYHDFAFDFLATTQARKPFMTQALSIWLKSPRSPNPQVLIDERGQLMNGVFRRLLDQRDNRPVVLVE